MASSTIASSLYQRLAFEADGGRPRACPSREQRGERKTAPFDRPSPARVREPSRSASFVITTTSRQAGGLLPSAQDQVASFRRGCLRRASMMPRASLRRSARRATFHPRHFGGLSSRLPSFAWDAFGRRRRPLFRQTDWRSGRSGFCAFVRSGVAPVEFVMVIVRNCKSGLNAPSLV